MESVNLSPIHIPENSFGTENNINLNPSKLNIYCPEKLVMSEAIVKMLKKITDLSNSNLIRNANGLLSKKLSDIDVEWVGKLKKRLLDNKNKMFS